MPYSHVCSSCGRKVGKNHNTWEKDNEKRPLCSFCAQRERRFLREKKAELERSTKFVYCKNCGVKHATKTSHEGYCGDCFRLLQKRMREMLELKEKRERT